MKQHPSRQYGFTSRFWYRTPLYRLWIAYVPQWVDTALRCLFWLILGVGILFGIFWE